MGKAQRKSRSDLARQWNESYFELEAYRAKRGNCDVPQRQSPFGRWVHTQREKRRKDELSLERIQKLDGLGFNWGTARASLPTWDERLEELREYKAAHGNCNVPKRKGFPLGGWVDKQRRQYRNDKLSGERVRKLNGLGFNWGTTQGPRGPLRPWDERLQELKEYKAVRGNCNVPKSQGQLGRWVEKQREKRRKGKLSEVRIRNLDDIGFNWSPRGTSTGRQVQFRQEKGQRGKAKTTNCASSPESGSSPEDGEVGGVAVDGGSPGSLSEPKVDGQFRYVDTELAGARAGEKPLSDGADGRSSEPGEGDGGSRWKRRSRRIILRSDDNSGEAAPKEDEGGDAPSSVPRLTTPRRSGSSAYGNPPPDPTAGSRPGAKRRSPSSESSNSRKACPRTRSEIAKRNRVSAPARSMARSGGSSDTIVDADPSRSSAMETDLTLMNGAEAVVELVGNGSAAEGAATASDDEEKPGSDDGADSDFDSGSSEFVLTNDNEGDVAAGSLSTGDKGAGKAASAAAEHLTSEQIKPDDGAAKSRQSRPSDEEDTAEDAGCPLETRLARAWTANEAMAGSKTAENEANARAEELQNKVSTLSEAAAAMEDDLQLADAEASLAARECESLRADIDRTDRLHEEELAVRDGDLADRDEAITTLETGLAGSKTAENEANTRAEELQNQVSTLREAAAKMEDGLQLADAEASLAVRECESLRADIERMNRLHEEELAMAEAALDGDLADRDDAIATLETEIARARSATAEANTRFESLQGDVFRLQVELASVKQRTLNAEEGRRVAEQLLIGKQSEMHELESDYRRKEAEFEAANAAVEQTQSEKKESESEKKEAETRLGEVKADLRGMKQKLDASQASVKEGQATIATLEMRKGEVESKLKVARSDLMASNESNSFLRSVNVKLKGENKNSAKLLENARKEDRKLRQQHGQLKTKVSKLEGSNHKLKDNKKELVAQIDDLKTKLKGSLEGDADIEKTNLRDALREAIVTEKPKVSWDDVAGLDQVKETLEMTVMFPVKYPQLFTEKRKPLKGILLYGPPGTGKSYLAKAVATETDSTFFSVSSSDLKTKWQGESERLVKNLFEMARESPGARAIIFIDEIDSLCGSRKGGDSDGARGILTEFLKQMDGVGIQENDVLVLGATNLPWELDPAIRRRFEMRVYIPLPGREARSGMVKIHLGNTPNTLTGCDIDKLGQMTEGASGSDIHVLVKRALLEPVRKCRKAQQFLQVGSFLVPCKQYPNCSDCPVKLPADPSSKSYDCSHCGAKSMQLRNVQPEKLKAPDVCIEDFESVLKHSYSSVSKEDLEKYERWTEEFGEVCA